MTWETPKQHQARHSLEREDKPFFTMMILPFANKPAISRQMIRRQMKRWDFIPSRILLPFLTLLLIDEIAQFPAIGATDIKWTPNRRGGTGAAATAPRSQKYWDEHGVERPDYAKTDAEIAAERRAGGSDGGGGTGGTIAAAALLLVALPFAYLFRTGRVVLPESLRRGKNGFGGGSRLGASENGASSGGLASIFDGGKASPEEARRARLAKFDRLSKSD